MKPIATFAAIGALSVVLSAAAAPSAGAGAVHSGQALRPAAAATHSAQPATRGPSHTGQPNQSCETTPNPPGKSATAPGSAFNPDGRAGQVYAGEQPQNSRNTASVSQYDVACARPTR